MKTNYFKYYLSFLTLLIGVAFSAQDNRSIIQDFLEENKEKHALQSDDFADLIITDEYFSESTNVTHVYVKQLSNGIEVVDGVANFNILNGEVYSWGNSFVKGLSQKSNSVSPKLSAIEAIGQAANQLNIDMVKKPVLIEKNSTQSYLFDKAGISLENIPVKLVYQSTKSNGLRLAWDLSISDKDSENWWSVTVDASTGELLRKNNWTVHCAFGESEHDSHRTEFQPMEEEAVVQPPLAGSYNVFAIPTESPIHGPRVIVTDPEDLVASPLGWHDDDGEDGADYTTSRGNNVHAYDDILNEDIPGSSAEGGSALNFDFSYDPAVPAIDNLDAAITNLFYMSNIMHDVWFHYGFNEQSGNFQETHYSDNGGANGDYLRAEAQDGSGTNNANFSTPPDGARPRMQMFLWTTNANNNFTVNAPPSSATLDIEYVNSTANFGPDIPMIPITADLVLVTDEQGVDPYDACQDIANADELEGKIAVIRRGDCEFGFKTLVAENEGALAVIIVNNVGGDPVQMGGGAVGVNVTIPAIMLSDVQGQILIDALENGDLVNGTIVNPDQGLVANDSDFDNGIVAHEYGHGISTRLTGGGGNSNCLFNAEQMGEGWSDWFGIMLTMDEDDLAEDPRGVGTYVIGQMPDGNGIRPAPYSTDFGVNDFTYGDTNNDAISEPHGIGFIWATMLWDLNWALIDQYGFDSDFYNGTGGNNIAMQLVIDGLKLQSCNPGFVAGRNAILEADMLNYDGANQCLIWQVFANRGLGESASQGSSDSRFDQTQAFDIPAMFGTTQEFFICEGESIEVNGTLYDEAGTFVEVFDTNTGCDSTVTTIVSFFADTDITIDVNTLTAVIDNEGVTYQWIDCSDNSEIVGATGQQYEATESGDYAVIITENGCSGTSECVSFIFVGITDFLNENITISPNPTSGLVQINLGDVNNVTNVLLNDVQGRTVMGTSYSGENVFSIDLENLSAGVYFLNVITEEGRGVYKVIKE